MLVTSRNLLRQTVSSSTWGHYSDSSGHFDRLLNWRRLYFIWLGSVCWSGIGLFFLLRYLRLPYKLADVYLFQCGFLIWYGGVLGWNLLDVGQRSSLLLLRWHVTFALFIKRYLSWILLRVFNRVNDAVLARGYFLPCHWRKIFFGSIEGNLSILLQGKANLCISFLRNLFGKPEGSIHLTVFELLGNLLLEFPQFFFYFLVDVARLVQQTTRQTHCIPTWRALSLSKHSVANLAEVRFPVDIFCFDRLWWHFILVVVILRREKRTEEATMVRHISGTKRLAHRNGTVVFVCLHMSLVQALGSKLGGCVHLSGWLPSVAFLSGSLCSNHLQVKSCKRLLFCLDRAN